MKNKKSEWRKPIDLADIQIGAVMGSATGDSEHTMIGGGWAGSDDSNSSAPSDQLGNPPIPEEDKSYSEISQDMEASLELAEEEQLSIQLGEN